MDSGQLFIHTHTVLNVKNIQKIQVKYQTGELLLPSSDLHHLEQKALCGQDCAMVRIVCSSQTCGLRTHSIQSIYGGVLPSLNSF